MCSYFVLQVLDIFGKPKRRFFEMLALTAQDPAERAELEHLITKVRRGADGALHPVYMLSRKGQWRCNCDRKPLLCAYEEVKLRFS